LVNANATYDIGSSSQSFANVYAVNYYGNGASLSGIITSVSNINNGTTNMTVVSSGGNIAASVGGTSNVMVISSGLVAITGDLSVSGNATLSGNILGDRIQNGTTQIDIQSPNGNANVTIGGTANTAVFSTTALTLATNLLPSANITYDLGSTTQRWKDLWLSNSTIYLGNAQISANTTAIIITNPDGGVTVLQGASPSITGNVVSVSGNITGGNVLFGSGIVSGTGNITGGNVLFGSGIVSGTGNITGGNVLFGSGRVSGVGNVSAGFFLGNGSQLTGLSSAVSVTKIENGTSEGNVTSSGGNIAFTIGGIGNVMVLATTGAIVTGLSTPSIEHTGTNAVGNIGSSASYFNRLFATATTALYADVAERFAADEELAPGTVVELGGTAEITRSQQDLSENVFGVISTNAAYLMNGGAGEDNTHPPVAMTGRVPVQVVGVVRKGDRLVSAGSGVARAAQPGEATAFNVIGRALVDKLTPGPGTIEAIVTIK
jgi:hypothetical protein